MTPFSRWARMVHIALRLGLSLAGVLVAGPTLAQTPALPALPPVLLVGVVIPEGGVPMAIVEDPRTHRQTIHTLGSQIGDVTLTKVLRDRVLLSSGDSAIEVRLSRPTPPPPPPPRPVVRFRPPRGRRFFPR